LSEFRDILRVSEAITAKRMKIDPYCQQRICSPLNALFSDVFTLISHGVPPLGGVKQGRGAENKPLVGLQVKLCDNMHTSVTPCSSENGLLMKNLSGFK